MMPYYSEKSKSIVNDKVKKFLEKAARESLADQDISYVLDMMKEEKK